MKKPYVENATDKKQIEHAAYRSKRDRVIELEDIRLILSTREGRRFYYRYLNLCGVFVSSFTGTSTTFFNEGKRDIGLRLLADLNDADPEKYILMITENKTEDNHE